MEDIEKKIIAYYIDIRMVDEIDIPEFMGEVQRRISLHDEHNHYTYVFIPVFSETRIECINPIYITDTELIKKNERLMAELNENLGNDLVKIKGGEDES